ncbi:MAG TPA: hypothetical protein VFY84_15645, partial [Jiangellales bacterium]|nr:hypothetical protein [Jiangellales bacterium]
MGAAWYEPEHRRLGIDIPWPRPPLWVGGSGRKRTLPLVARYADAWHTNRLGSYRELSAELD